MGWTPILLWSQEHNNVLDVAVVLELATSQWRRGCSFLLGPGLCGGLRSHSWSSGQNLLFQSYPLITLFSYTMLCNKSLPTKNSYSGLFYSVYWPAENPCSRFLKISSWIELQIPIHKVLVSTSALLMGFFFLKVHDPQSSHNWRLKGSQIQHELIWGITGCTCLSTRYTAGTALNSTERHFRASPFGGRY